MPIDYYPQKTEEELLVLLDTLQARGAKGAITEVSAAGVRTVRQAPSGSTCDRDVLRVLYSLYKRNPDAYSDPYASRITRTLPSYTS